MAWRTLFLTGASGFVGRHLLRRLEGAGYERIVCPVRGGAGSLEAAYGRQLPEGVEVVAKSLADVEARDIPKGARVCHLAARTGKARPARFHADNVEATARLIDAARSAGADGIVHVSTIAAGFPETKAYPYARTKAAAEELVRGSQLDHAVVRPTIVLGATSPALESMKTLAGAPRILVFGKGDVRVQPIDVADLCTGLRAILARPVLGGALIELGGPEVLSFEELLRRVRRRIKPGRGDGVLHLPLGATISVLALLEPVLLPVLPLAAGQLYAFRFDSVAAPLDEADADLIELQAHWKGVDAMLRQYFEQGPLRG